MISSEELIDVIRSVILRSETYYELIDLRNSIEQAIIQTHDKDIPKELLKFSDNFQNSYPVFNYQKSLSLYQGICDDFLNSHDYYSRRVMINTLKELNIKFVNGVYFLVVDSDWKVVRKNRKVTILINKFKKSLLPFLKRLEMLYTFLDKNSSKLDYDILIKIVFKKCQLS